MSNKSDEKKIFKFKAELSHERYYNEDTYYGVIEFKTNEDVPHTTESDFHSFGGDKNGGTIRTGMLVGSMQKLDYGVTYNIVAEESESKKFGMQLLVHSAVPEELSTLDKKAMFLETITTKKQSDELLKVYPNIIEMIMNNDVEELDLSSVSGVKEKTFEKIKKKVIDNYVIQDILVLLRPIGVKYNTIIKLLDIEENAMVLKKKIIANPYILTNVRGIGFSKADDIALKLNPDLKVSTERTEAFLKYKLKEIGSSKGDTWVNRNILSREVRSAIPKCFSIYEEILEKNEEDPTLLVVDGKMVGLKLYYNMEQNIIKTLYELDMADSAFEKPSEEQINNSIYETETSQGFEFMEEQRDAIRSVVDHNVVIITGSAGSGKTSVVKGITNLLSTMTLTDAAAYAAMDMIDQEDVQEYLYSHGKNWRARMLQSFKKNISLSQVALSACAAKRIAQATSRKASTIHRELKYDGSGFSHNKDNRLPSYGNVIDEMSMDNISILNSYFQAIMLGAKLVLVFDFAQLEAIGAGDMSRDILSSDLCINKFTKVHRQGQKSGILMDANKVRDGINPISKLEPKITTGELQDMHYRFTNDVGKMEQFALKRFVSAAEDIGLDNVLMVTPKRKNGRVSCMELNKKIQNMLIDDFEDFVPQKKFGIDTNFRLGSKVMQRENDYTRMAFNGDVGYIIAINTVDKSFVVSFTDSGNECTYDFREIDVFDLAYCQSVHSMQGSQAHTVIGLIDNSSFIMLNRKILYTLMTRAKERCLLVCQPKAFKACIDDENNKDRKTWSSMYFEKAIDFGIEIVDNYRAMKDWSS